MLFLCTGNSCRSQMAEGWARHLKGDVIEPYSAGIETHGLNPLAVKVMAEAGVDISGQRSKHVDELQERAVRLRGHRLRQRQRDLPVLSGQGQGVHVGFDDPPRLAKTARSEEEALGHYRRVRDEIRRFVGVVARRPGIAGIAAIGPLHQGPDRPTSVKWRQWWHSERT